MMKSIAKKVPEAKPDLYIKSKITKERINPPTKIITKRAKLSRSRSSVTSRTKLTQSLDFLLPQRLKFLHPASKAKNPTPKPVDLKFLFDEAIEFYKNPKTSENHVKAIKSHIQEALSSYPTTEIRASSSSLMRHVVVKEGHVAVTTFENGLTIFKIEDDMLKKSGGIYTEDMYLKVELNRDCKMVFSYRYSQAFDYWALRKKRRLTQREESIFGQVGQTPSQSGTGSGVGSSEMEDMRYERIQNLRDCFDTSDGGNVNEVMDIKYSDAQGLLAVVVRLEHRVCVSTLVFNNRSKKSGNVTSSLLGGMMTAREGRFEFKEYVRGSDNASFLSFTSDGSQMVVAQMHEDEAIGLLASGLGEQTSSFPQGFSAKLLRKLRIFLPNRPLKFRRFEHQIAQFVQRCEFFGQSERKRGPNGLAQTPIKNEKLPCL